MNDVLLDCLREPARMAGLGAADWTALLRRARPHALLGKLARGAAAAGIGEGLPGAVRRQFASAERLCVYGEAHLRAEALFVLHALRGADTPVLFLKGTAYALAGLAVARGRVSSDVDILVPRARLDQAERALGAAGWQGLALDDYDQRYYREWMHELPPLRHRHRAAVMDVHHTILPPTGRIRPDAAALLRDAVAVRVHGLPGLVPQPADMLIHAAVHLFQDGDLDGRLRELLDVHELAGEFAVADPAFWDRLAERARLHGAGRPLFHALDFARRLLGTRVPPALFGVLTPRPGAIPRRTMAVLVPSALIPGDPERRGAVFARRLLLARSHWLKMPPPLLARHLAVKAWRGLRARLASRSSG
jgi:hypothetical protein